MFVLVQNSASVVVFIVPPLRVCIRTCVLSVVRSRFVPTAPKVSGVSACRPGSGLYEARAVKFVVGSGEGPSGLSVGEIGWRERSLKYVAEEFVRIVRGPIGTGRFVCARLASMVR